MIQVYHDVNEVTFVSALYTSSPFWGKTRLFTRPDGQIIKAVVITDNLLAPFPIMNSDLEDSIIFKHSNSNQLESVSIFPEEYSEYSSYRPMQLEQIKYNSMGYPASSQSKTQMYFYLARNDSVDFRLEYEYQRAADVPTLLKRMVNEELLFSNRYGVTILDFYFIDDTRNYSQFGEGNWLISFGLPQYYILEEKSKYMVSQRTTDYYQLDSLSGEREYIKTKVEDFPYIHDAAAKTLEIAGLKIWYEFVE